MVDWNAVNFFCEVARVGSFTSASRNLSIPIATLIRKVNLLEEELGVNLFHRSTRKITLTKDGEQLFNKFGDKFDTLRKEFINHRCDLFSAHDVVRIATLPELAAIYIYPLLPSLTNKLPSLQLEFEFSVDLVDLNIGSVDFALRAGIPMSEHLRVCKLGTDRLPAYRNKSYKLTDNLPLAVFDKTFTEDGREPSLIIPSMSALCELAKKIPIEVYLSEKWLQVTKQCGDLKENPNLASYDYDIYLAYGLKRPLSSTARIVMNTIKDKVFDGAAYADQSEHPDP